MWVAWLLLSAFSAEVVLSEPTVVRRYKIESFGYAPTRGDRWDLDWRRTMLEYWSAVLVCERTYKRTDRCTFAGDVLEFGFVVEGDERLQSYLIAAPDALGITYSKTGKVTVTVEGKRDAFREQIATALLGRHERPEGRYWKPDQWRQIGTNMEDGLRFWLGAALELQLPRKGDGSAAWRADAPALAQTWTGGAYGGSTDLQVAGEDGALLTIVGQGRFGEVYPGNPDWSVKGTTTVGGVFDTTHGHVTRTRTEIAYQVHLPGYMTQRLALMRLAEEGDDHHVGQIPGSPLRP